MWQRAGHQTAGEDVLMVDAQGPQLHVSLDLTFRSVPGGPPAANSCILPSAEALNALKRYMLSPLLHHGWPPVLGG